MSRFHRIAAALVLASFAAFAVVAPAPAHAESAASLEADASAALKALYQTTPGSKELAAKAKAIVVFPTIVKAGFIVGGAYGQGVKFRGDEVVGYYSSVAGSYGLQAGAQAFGYALFLMTEDAVRYLDRSEGFELGVGPSFVIVDSGIAKNLSTTTLKKDVYGFIFDQKGLMAGIGIQGTKITRISK
jgi:lipid-binding SYLF domain-containing protein